MLKIVLSTNIRVIELLIWLTAKPILMLLFANKPVICGSRKTNNFIFTFSGWYFNISSSFLCNRKYLRSFKMIIRTKCRPTVNSSRGWKMLQFILIFGFLFHSAVRYLDCNMYFPTFKSKYISFRFVMKYNKSPCHQWCYRMPYSGMWKHKIYILSICSVKMRQFVVMHTIRIWWFAQ